MVIFNGRQWAREREARLKRQVKELKERLGWSPRLVVILIGDDPASRLYLKRKAKTANRVGIKLEKKEFPEKVTPKEVVKLIKKANQEKQVAGIVVQLPLPSSLGVSDCQMAILATIAPLKDVDCLTAENQGRLLIGPPRFLPATVKAILATAKVAFGPSASGWRGRVVTIVGSGRLVGLPLAVVLKNLGATVVLCDQYTPNLTQFTRQAEVLISATGVPGLIKKKMVKPGAIVIDAGAPKAEVDFEAVKKVASFITPVPGGVGPVTIVSLLENTLQATQLLSFQTG